jgi:hypothetical protein
MQMESGYSIPKQEVTNDFCLATNRILAYTRYRGNEEFIVTYFGMIEFNEITSDPIRTVVMTEALSDQMPICIFLKTGKCL